MKKIRLSLRILGRKALPKRWHENRHLPCHAPASYRRPRVRMVRHKENHHLRNMANNGLLEDYESLGLVKRDADWFYF